MSGGACAVEQPVGNGLGGNYFNKQQLQFNGPSRISVNGHCNPTDSGSNGSVKQPFARKTVPAASAQSIQVSSKVVEHTYVAKEAEQPAEVCSLRFFSLYC